MRLQMGTFGRNVSSARNIKLWWKAASECEMNKVVVVVGEGKIRNER